MFGAIRVRTMKIHKTTLAITVAAGLSLVGMNASAADMAFSPYLGISGVASVADDVDFDNDKGALSSVNTAEFELGNGGLLRGGLRFGELRAELELGYRTFDFDGVKGKSGTTGDVEALTAMINGAWDIDTGTDFTPYVMIGAGVISVDGDLTFNNLANVAQTKSFDGTAPAGQLGVGIGYKLTDQVELTGGYSLLLAPTDKTGQDEVIKIQSVQLGLNFNF